MKNLIIFVLIIYISTILYSREALHGIEVKLRSFLLISNKIWFLSGSQFWKWTDWYIYTCQKEIKRLLFDKDYVLKDSFITDKPKGSVWQY